jgi:hypothetical protein
MKIAEKIEDLKMIAAWIVYLAAAGALIEGLHWAFFEPKPVIAWIAVLASTAGLLKWAHWELYGRPEEPSEDEKKYAAWFDA